VGRNGSLLYALLDAAESNGMLSSPSLGTRWREARERIALSRDFEGEEALFRALLAELESSGALTGTWIGQRWFSVKGRMISAR
jgi:hypothetical protein